MMLQLPRNFQSRSSIPGTCSRARYHGAPQLYLGTGRMAGLCLCLVAMLGSLRLLLALQTLWELFFPLCTRTAWLLATVLVKWTRLGRCTALHR